MITNFQDFANFKYQTSKDIFTDNPDFGISGIKYDSKTLLVNSQTSNLENIHHYHSLKFIEFNDYALKKQDINALKNAQNRLRKVRYLSFWNARLANLKPLIFFKGVNYLNIAHFQNPNFTFQGIQELLNLKTLCLLKTGGVKDLTGLTIAGEIENFSLIQPTNIKNTDGIENLFGLKYLNIEGSLDTIYRLESLNGLNRLSTIERIKFRRIYIPLDQLILALKNLGLIDLDIDHNLYDVEQYKEISKELINVKSRVFHPFTDEGTYIQPVGKGKKRVLKTSKRYEEIRDLLIKDWYN